jgi:hypothetical protein
LLFTPPDFYCQFLFGVGFSVQNASSKRRKPDPADIETLHRSGFPLPRTKGETKKLTVAAHEEKGRAGEKQQEPLSTLKVKVNRESGEEITDRRQGYYQAITRVRRARADVIKQGLSLYPGHIRGGLWA